MNSYYRIKLTQTLPPIGDYLPKANQEQLRFNHYVRSFDSQFKKIVKEVYSEKFVNSSQLPDKIDETKTSLVSLRENFRSRYDRYSHEYENRLPEPMLDSITNLEYLLGNFSQLSDNNLTSTYLSYDQLRVKLETLMQNGLEENQTSTFKDEFIDVFYEKQLATLDGFKMHRGDQAIFLDEKSSYGVINFSIYLPFHDLNQSQNIKSNCSCTDYLPKFFSVETVPVEKNRTRSDESD